MYTWVKVRLRRLTDGAVGCNDLDARPPRSRGENPVGINPDPLVALPGPSGLVITLRDDGVAHKSGRAYCVCVADVMTMLGLGTHSEPMAVLHEVSIDDTTAVPLPTVPKTA